MSSNRPCRYSLFVLLCVSPLCGAAQEHIQPSLSSHSHSLEAVRETTLRLPSLSYLNPSDVVSNLNEFTPSLSQVQAGYRHDGASLAVDAQQGTGAELMFFRAQSHLRISKKSVAWGEAVYENGSRQGISWNLNSDYQRVFPYVIADTATVSMRREYYLFRGGYAHQMSRLSIGAEMSYRSTIEYRDRDPRPKNTTLDVQLHFGGGYAVSARRVVGLYAGIGKYTQQSDVQFMNPQGNRVLYHLTGLGMQYFRFKGLQNGVKYEGGNYSAGLSTHTKDGLGLQASTDLEYENIQKRLSSERDIPICDVFQTKWRGELSWTGQWRRWDCKVTFSAETTKREGQERYFDSGLTNYKEIASSRPFIYQHQGMQLSLSALYKFTPAIWLVMLPRLAYDVDNTQYLTPVRQLKTAFLVPSLKLDLSRMFSRSLLSVGFLSHVGRQVHHHFVFTEPQVFDKPVGMFRNNAFMQQASYWDAGLHIRYDFRLVRSLTSAFMQMQLGRRWYDNHQHGHNLEISMGVTL